MSAPPGGYREALEGVALIDRSARRRLRMSGRAPTQMLQGIVTNRVPPPLEPVEPGVWSGRAPYAAVLTPKGRPVTDLRVLRRGTDEEHGLLLDLPAEGADAAAAHFAHYVPPRMARFEDVSETTGHLTLVGPGAAALAARVALGLRVDTAALEGLAEGELRFVGEPGGDGIWVVASADVAAPALDLLSDRATIVALRGRLESAGATPLSPEAWTVLRLEAGRPAYGVDFDEDVRPPEAGIVERAVDHGKGCYTGQEVIVRIRDRGRVNRHLRGLVLGDGKPAAPGTELWAEGRDRAVGALTSAAFSPRAGAVLGLGYVRREVEVGGEVRVGAPDGDAARVRAAGPGWWEGARPSEGGAEGS
ncbi:MAG: hypothetical protein KY453_10770 [Gemmatimonadetes bacterium]|nr:hypothetical protein [Gemmatimonadota bacterium]